MTARFQLSEFSKTNMVSIKFGRVTKLFVLGIYYRYTVQCNYTFNKIDTTMFTGVYTTLMRIKLETFVQATSLCLKGDLDILKNVQRAASRAIPKLRSLPYKEALEELYSITLPYRRIRDKLIFDVCNNKKCF